MIQRRKSNSSKINLTISAIFHTLLVFAVFFFAARQGMLGKKLKEITVTMVPKEKKPEPPKEKPPEPKVEQPKLADAPKPVIPPPQAAVAPPPSDSAPAVAPAAASLPAFEFSDGAHQVESISDPNAIYKALVEHSLRARWNRPENIQDDKYVVDVEVTVEKDGTVDGYRWIKLTGDERWDKSVREVLAQTKVIDRPPPKGFPTTFIVRFDVQSEAVEDTIRLGSL